MKEFDEFGAFDRGLRDFGDAYKIYAGAMQLGLDKFDFKQSQYMTQGTVCVLTLDNHDFLVVSRDKLTQSQAMTVINQFYEEMWIKEQRK